MKEPPIKNTEEWLRWWYWSSGVYKKYSFTEFLKEFIKIIKIYGHKTIRKKR